MIVLLGDTRQHELVRMLEERGWGRMWVDRRPEPYPGEPWGFDNGAFSDWTAGRPFDADAFERRLERARRTETAPYMAVLPDLVAGGLRSLDFSLSWRERIGEDEWPWYLAVQDGMHLRDVAPLLDGWFAGVFLGGTTRFKSTAPRWCALAHELGLRFHYARASTIPRVMDARAIKADSIDSSFPLWNRSRLDEFCRAAGKGEIRQARLWNPALVNLVAEEYLG